MLSVCILSTAVAHNGGGGSWMGRMMGVLHGGGHHHDHHRQTKAMKRACYADAYVLIIA